MGQPRCSSWYSTQDCSNSQQNHRHANHCCSCRRQSHREHRQRPMAPTISPIKLFQCFTFLLPFKYYRGVPRIPRPLCGRLFTRKGSPDGPAGIRHKIVQIHSRTTDTQTIGAGAADKRIIHLAGIIPTAITGIGGI